MFNQSKEGFCPSQPNLEAETQFLEAEKSEAQGLSKEAFRHLLRAAKLGHTGAQVNVGNSLFSGEGVRKSPKKGAYWYKRAYRNGDESGALNLAIDKLKQRNYRAAIFWLKRAVAMRSGEAALELAKLYLNRRGGKKALELLRNTQTMSRAEISKQAKEDALALLAELGTRTDPRPSVEDRSTAYDRAKRAGLIGAVQNAGRDLSTNPKYFDGFGKS